MRAAHVAERIRQLIGVLDIALRGILFRTDIDRTEVVNKYVGKVLKARRRGELRTDRASVRAFGVVNDVARKCPNVRENSFVIAGSLRAQELRRGKRRIKIGLPDAIVQVARAELMLAHRQVGVHAEIVLVDVRRSHRGQIAYGNCVAVYCYRPSVVLGCYWKLFEDIGDCAVGGQCLQCLEPTGRRKLDLGTGCCETFVLEFVGAKNEPFVANDRATGGSAQAIVVKAILQPAVLLLVIKGVVVAIAVVLPRRSMPVVGAGLRYRVEYSTGGMAIFSAELISEQREFSDRFLDDRLGWSVCVQLVVFNAVNVESVEAGTRSANRPSRAENATLLSCCPRREDREFLDVAAQCIHG